MAKKKPAPKKRTPKVKAVPRLTCSDYVTVHLGYELFQGFIKRIDRKPDTESDYGGRDGRRLKEHGDLILTICVNDVVPFTPES